MINKDLEILVRMFYYNKYLREKENCLFREIKEEENSEIVYLIHNSWLEEYKSYFDYHSWKNYSFIFYINYRVKKYKILLN